MKVASLYSGYSIQYLRRLLRQARLKGVKLGQVWFIEKGALDRYLKQATQTVDNRFGPQNEHIFSQTYNIQTNWFEVG